MKSLHKFILKAYIGPFLITLSVLVFIFLMQYIAKYVDDFVGKGLEASTFLELIFYFSFNMVPRALPLAIMLSALMTYGNLGEHNELTAIKSSGVSLIRILYPTFFFVVLVSVGLFVFSNAVLPKTNLKAYSLLHDMRHKKPALEFREGIFYNGLPNYTIRIGEKHEDGQTIKDVLIYDHSEGRGNLVQLLADSGKMYTINNDAHLVFELFDGQRNSNIIKSNGTVTDEYGRNAFKHIKMIFDLSSFSMERTDQQLFARNRFMLNFIQAQEIMDSIKIDINKEQRGIGSKAQSYFKYSFNQDSTNQYSSDTTNHSLITSSDSSLSYLNAVIASCNQVQSMNFMISNRITFAENMRKEFVGIGIEQVHKFTDSIACIVMFLIGAPIGSVLKKGGMGIPTLLTLVFFVLFYVISINGEKYAKAGDLNMYLGTSLSVLALFPIGVLFLYQAHRDARLFEFDELWQKLKGLFGNKR